MLPTRYESGCLTLSRDGCFGIRKRSWSRVIEEKNFDLRTKVMVLAFIVKTKGIDYSFSCSSYTLYVNSGFDSVMHIVTVVLAQNI